MAEREIRVKTRKDIDTEQSATFVLFVVIIALSSGVGWKLANHGEIGILIGAAVGFAGSLFIPAIRQMLMVLAVFAAGVTGLVLLVSWIYSGLPEEEEAQSASTETSAAADRQARLDAVRQAIEEARKPGITVTPPMTQEQIAQDEQTRREKIAAASLPRTKDIAAALSATLDLTATTNEAFKAWGTRSALALKRQEAEFCEDTKAVLGRTYTGRIKSFTCNYQEVSVVTQAGVTTYSAKTNQAITQKGG